jgi:hypothetical protein
LIVHAAADHAGDRKDKGPCPQSGAPHSTALCGCTSAVSPHVESIGNNAHWRYFVLSMPRAALMNPHNAGEKFLIILMIFPVGG